jgi:FemAB family protein
MKPPASAVHSRLGTDAVQDGLPPAIARTVAGAGVPAVVRRDDAGRWDRTLQALPYIPVAYSSASIDYQLAYQVGHGGDWWDTSLILHHNSRPCGVWPMSFSVKDGNAAITSHGLPVLPPLFVKELPARSRANVVKQCLSLFEALCRAGGVAHPESAESFAAQPESGFSEWHEQSMHKGAIATCRHELFVDLSLEMETIKARFRKSYKSLVTSGTRLWKTGVMSAADPALWESFHALHLHVAGRATRSVGTWELQHRAIVDGHAFLVHLHDDHGRLVGGGFFSMTRDEGAYSVAAYDRSLFEKPLGHVVQYRAIEEMRRRGLRWYKIGARPFRGELPTPTEKELSIAEFKHGFATHLFPQYDLRHDIEPAEPEADRPGERTHVSD